MSRFLFLAALGLLLSVATLASASGSAPHDLDAIRSQQQAIRADAEAKRGRYKDMTEARRTELFASQDLALRAMGTSRSASELTEQQRIDVFNALEKVEAIVNKAEDERMVCQRTKPVGSNRPQTVCHTVAQLRAEERNNEQRRNQVCVDAWSSGACDN